MLWRARRSVAAFTTRRGTSRSARACSKRCCAQTARIRASARPSRALVRKRFGHRAARRARVCGAAGTPALARWICTRVYEPNAHARSVGSARVADRRWPWSYSRWTAPHFSMQSNPGTRAARSARGGLGAAPTRGLEGVAQIRVFVVPNVRSRPPPGAHEQQQQRHHRRPAVARSA